MKRIILHSLVICSLHLSLPISAQQAAPLKVGNVWVYDVFPGKVRYSIIDSNVIVDSISYFNLKSQYHFGSFNSFVRITEQGYYAIRRDSSYPAPNNEELYYKINAKIGDSWLNPDPPSTYTVIDTFISNVFGNSTTIKYLVIDAGLVILDEYWTDEFGLLSSIDFGSPLKSLLGCVIDGQVYGDTSYTIVSVFNEPGPISLPVLNQNYPNPFNPITTISYSIKENGLVTLKVFDILGKEVATLANESQQEGFYSVEFNAEELPSGIYFYTLTSSSFKQTKKLILLR
jgi:hypothetical protein